MHQHPFDRALLRQRRKAKANTGAASSVLHAEIGARAIDDLEFIKRDFRKVLVIAGNHAELKNSLQQIYSDATIYTLYFLSSADVVADEDLLPFADHSFDLIINNLSLHLINDIPGCLAQIRRILKPDGLFNATLLAGESLRELREVFLQAEAELTGNATSRLIPLPDFTALPGLLQRAGFALPVAHQEVITLSFSSFFDVLANIRDSGFANFTKDRARKSIGRDVISRAAELYGQNYALDDGRVKVTAQITYLSGWAPAESQQNPLARGSAKHRLADAL